MQKYHRKCFSCGRELNFETLLQRNHHSYSRVELINLWKDESVDFFCLTCLSEIFRRTSRSHFRKVFVLGLPGTGKSSFLSILKNPNFDVRINPILPTSRLRIEYVSLSENYVLWEYGGSTRNRNLLKANPKKYLRSLNSILFFHDLSNKKTRTDSAEFLKDIFLSIEDLYKQRSLPSFTIVFNKMDLLSETECVKEINAFIKLIATENKICIFKTSLLEKRYFSSMNAELNDLSYIINK